MPRSVSTVSGRRHCRSSAEVARPAEPGRRALLDAGERLLAKGTSLSRLSANAVVAEASLSKGAFFQHFARTRDYVVELHRQFHDQLASEIGDALAHQPAGYARLIAGIECYLDYCLRHSGTKAFLFDARAHGDLAALVAQRNDQFAQIASADLAVEGWPQPLDTARLVVAAVAEAALIESVPTRRDAALRQALGELIRRDR